MTQMWISEEECIQTFGSKCPSRYDSLSLSLALSYSLMYTQNTYSLTHSLYQTNTHKVTLTHARTQLAYNTHTKHTLKLIYSFFLLRGHKNITLSFEDLIVESMFSDKTIYYPDMFPTNESSQPMKICLKTITVFGNQSKN